MVKEILNPKEYIQRLIAIWESSVKSTHHFLTATDFSFYKERMPIYLGSVDLFGYYDDKDDLVGFLGICGEGLEMLFVDNSSRGNGIGRALLNFAINSLGVKCVDVNEQNTQAIGFYQHFGFNVVGRSDVDGEGKFYPLLHLSL